MGKRRVSILEPAATSVAEVAWFIESRGLPKTAKKFVDDVFGYFEKLSDERFEHKPCTYSFLARATLPLYHLQEKICNSLSQPGKGKCHL